MLNIRLLSHRALGALREPGVISISASPLRVNHPIENDSQGFRSNLLSRLHKRDPNVYRDRAKNKQINKNNEINGNRTTLYSISQQ